VADEDRVRILGIAPYAGMRELMLNIAARRLDIDLEVFVGDLSDGVDIVTEHQCRGFSAIVSRGGTAEMIRKSANIPVSEITLSVYDVLRAIRLAQSYEGKFAIVGFPSITKCARLLCDMLKYEIDIVTINSQEDAIPCLKELKRQNCSMILGDMVTTVSAKLSGINGILITSGGESIESAFDHAVEISAGYRAGRGRIEFLEAALRTARDEIAVFNEGGELSFSSMSSPDEELISFMRRNARTVPDRGEKKIMRPAQDGSIAALFGKRFSTKDGSYCVYSITRLAKPGIYDGQGVTFQNKPDLLEDVDSLFSRSSSIGRLADTIQKYASADLPVLITGEQGTGKDKAANSIFVYGKLGDNPMISIDCGVISDKKWSQLLQDEYSPLSDSNLTIYLKNINTLNDRNGARLAGYLRDTDICRRNRMIFSYVVCRDAEENNYFYNYLRRDASCLVLRMPPLRQRPADIPSICSLYINDINAATGKQVIGLNPDAILMLQEYYWEHNLNQLKRVLAELVVLSDSSYISAGDVAQVLASEGAGQTSPDRGVNLNQSLDEITRDVARIIMKEEGENQSRAARRLQISRSTLWRMLKK
jgi:transcriptional regulator with PAS, ATPase and Fis domain